MSDLNDPLKESYIGKVGDALKPYAAELTAAGFNPTARIAQLTGAGDVIEAADKIRQDDEKTLTASVLNVHTIREGFYTTATATVSAVEGILGKDHALPVKLRAMRASLIGNQNPGGTPAPTPAVKPA
jgi:hypothetical protein